MSVQQTLSVLLLSVIAVLCVAVHLKTKVRYFSGISICQPHVALQSYCHTIKVLWTFIHWRSQVIGVGWGPASAHAVTKYKHGLSVLTSGRALCGTSIVLWPGTCPPRLGLRYATAFIVAWQYEWQVRIYMCTRERPVPQVHLCAVAWEM